MADPIAIAFPRDDAPHRRLTEWWYYTGHLVDAAGGHWGFEFVVFRAERGGFPVSWASHLALTDETGTRFLYAQRSRIGPQVDTSSATSFSFSLLGADQAGTPWTMAGSGGDDRLSATASAAEVAGSGAGTPFGIDLAVQSRKPPALHDGEGWVDFGVAGGAYYFWWRSGQQYVDEGPDWTQEPPHTTQGPLI